MRVTTDIFVSALIRRVFGDGGFAAVVRRGAAEAGAVFIVTRDRLGEAALYAPAAQAAYGEETPATRRFTAVGENLDQEALDRRLAREQRFDSDIWVVEIEPGRTPLAELLEITKP
jgi:hypothetical protein